MRDEAPDAIALTTAHAAQAVDLAAMAGERMGFRVYREVAVRMGKKV